MSNPLLRYACARCHAIYDTPVRYCGRCGAAIEGPGHKERRADSTDDDFSVETTTGGGSFVYPDLQRRASDGQDRWLGRVIDDRYRVLEIVGRGGMGVVYKVEHQRMGKIAAMKVLHHEYSREPQVVERFRREAATVSQLTHPNTVQIFDFGTTHGALYLIMEYVRGPDMSELLRRDGPIPFLRAAPMLAQICAALAEAHALGIIHRDLKPENILVTRTHRGRDVAKVLDFGLAKLGEQEESAEVTDRGSIVGTPYYMSPEQIRGELVDMRTDIYAVGSMMYRILTGTHAFSAKTPVGVLTKHLTEDVVPPSSRVPGSGFLPSLDDVVLRAMAKNPEDRYQTVGELLDAIEGAYAEECVSSGRMSNSALEIPATSSWGGTVGSARNLVGDDSDDIDYGIDSAIRLRRSDLDAYERSIRRRRFLLLALIPLVLSTLVAALIYVWAFMPAMPHRVEVEPNNFMDNATLIAADTPVVGYLGKRMSKSKPDRDFFHVSTPVAVNIDAADAADTVDPPGSHREETGDRGAAATKGQPPHRASGWLVDVEVSPLPNIDIELSLLDATGKVIAQVSEGGIGMGESLRHLRVEGEVYLLVSERMPPSFRLPTENVSDQYELTVSFAPRDPSRESEPNDGPTDADSLAVGTPMSGYLDRRGDVDFIRFVGEPGRYQLNINAAAELPIAWRIDDGELSEMRRMIVDLRGGEMLHVRRGKASAVSVPRDSETYEPLSAGDEPYTIELQRL